MSQRVTIFEVGPRDGLQNEPRVVTLRDKLRFISGLVSAGVGELELGSFVRLDRVPQMADTDLIYEAIRKRRLNLKRAHAWSLVPNQKGLERALAVGAKRIAVFTAASESFNRKNIGMSIEESLSDYQKLILESKKQGVKVRGYVSTAFGCPFEGTVSSRQALHVIERLIKIGVAQVSIGDTIGVATPKSVNEVIKPALSLFGPEKIAVHFHDTRGTALANSLRALELGVQTFDSSAGGLGGCPFAPGATGNLATEDLVYMLDGMGIKTGIHLMRLAEVSLDFAKRIHRPLSSRYLLAFASNCKLRKKTRKVRL